MTTVPRSPRKVFVVLPAYNEEHRIGNLLESIAEAMEEAALQYGIVVVDDGSSDGTAQAVRGCSERMPIALRQHERNEGLGAAIRDGLLAAANSAAGRDIVVTMDADDTHTPGLILRMVRMIREGCDVVIASRYQRGARSVGVPLSRAILSYAGSMLFRLVFPIKGVRDYTCGYRAYRADVLHQAVARYGTGLFDQEGFQCMVDILLKLRTMNFIFGEVPLILRYDIKKGASKMDVPKTVKNTLLLMFKRRFGK